MGLEDARQAMESAPQGQETPNDNQGEGEGQSTAGSSNGDLAPDSGQTAQELIDLAKTEKFLFDGKEMTADELRKSILRQQDYTKKTQTHAEERRKFEQERQQYQQQREETEKYDSNVDADIQNVLRDPTMESKFKEIYPAKYHAKLDQALNQAFGDQGSPQRNERLLEQRLNAIEGRFQSQEQERARQSFESEVKANAEILESSITRLATKYPMADEDSVLARAEHLATQIKKDANFNDNFFATMEKLYKENHAHHEKRYQETYKQQVERQKQANTRGKDVGRGGATPGAAPTKLKLKDVKNHILSTMGQ